jgi:voltage-gated potassium channel Kch
MTCPLYPGGNAATAGAAYADWRGQVIVCGLRGVGLRIVEQLTLSGVPAVVVDDDPDPPLAQMIEAWGVPPVTGASRSEEVLMSAGLAGAIAVICAQHDDLRARWRQRCSRTGSAPACG